jgi:hypothetical protein
MTSQKTALFIVQVAVFLFAKRYSGSYVNTDVSGEHFCFRLRGLSKWNGDLRMFRGR